MDQLTHGQAAAAGNRVQYRRPGELYREHGGLAIAVVDHRRIRQNRKQDFAAMLASQEHMSAAASLAHAEPRLYSVVSTHER
jgi:hypothetical protein